jgi:hypothetical protein
LDWLPLSQLRDHPLVDDLYELIPRALHGPFFYGHYTPLEDGSMTYRFRED